MASFRRQTHIHESECGCTIFGAMTNVWVKQRPRRGLWRWKKCDASPNRVEDELSICDVHGDVSEVFESLKIQIKAESTNMLEAIPQYNTGLTVAIYAIGIGDVWRSLNSLKQLAFAWNLCDALENSRLYVVEPCLTRESRQFLESLDIEMLPVTTNITDETAVNAESTRNWLRYWEYLMADYKLHDSASIIMGFHCPPVISLGISVSLLTTQNVVAFNNSPSAYACHRIFKDDPVRVLSHNLSRLLTEVEVVFSGEEFADAFSNMTVQFTKNAIEDEDHILQCLFP